MGDRSIAQQVNELGEITDSYIKDLRPRSMSVTLQYKQHEQRVRNAIKRFKQNEAWTALPHRVEALVLRAAFTSMPKD